MMFALSKFVSIRSVSSMPAHRDDCRQAAVWLKKCLSQLGAQTYLVCRYFCPLSNLFKRFPDTRWRRQQSFGVSSIQRDKDYATETSPVILWVSFGLDKKYFQTYSDLLGIMTL